MLTYLDFSDHVNSYMAKKAISSLKNSICFCTNSFPYKNTVLQILYMQVPITYILIGLKSDMFLFILMGI